MKKFSRTFNVLIYEAHLLGEIEKVMKLLDKHGKYFYIKHYKNDVAPHYHIYYLSNRFKTEEEIVSIFENNIATKVFADVMRGDKQGFIEYLLGYNEYELSDIVSTMSLK